MSSSRTKYIIFDETNETIAAMIEAESLRQAQQKCEAMMKEHGAKHYTIWKREGGYESTLKIEWND